jgi:membrane protein DedA with SNARE-associated domain
MMSDLFADLAQWVVEVVYSFGYGGVAVLIALINLHVLPIPTQLILGLAGFLVGQGRFSFTLVLVTSTAGTLSASLALYFLGHWVGEESLRRLVGRFGRFVFVDESDLDKAGKLFERHGGKAVLIGHLIPGVTAFISVLAGLKRMPIRGRFLFYTFLGTALWNGVLICLGWALGAEWTLVKEYAPIVEYAVLVAVAAGISWFVWRRWRARG